MNFRPYLLCGDACFELAAWKYFCLSAIGAWRVHRASPQKNTRPVGASIAYFFYMRADASNVEVDGHLHHAAIIAIEMTVRMRIVCSPETPPCDDPRIGIDTSVESTSRRLSARLRVHCLSSSF